MTEANIRILRKIVTDVAVVGGGTAGCFAAICSAQTGAKTLLLEKNGVLGGTVTTAGVAFPGLFHAWGRQIIAGPCWDSILYAQKLGGAVLPEITAQPAYHWQEQVPVNNFIYSTVLDKMCAEAGVDTWLHVMVCDAREDETGITLIVATKEGAVEVRCKKAVDATGDGNLAQLLGYPMQASLELQPATLINDLSGYDVDKLDQTAFVRFQQEKENSGELLAEDYQGFSLWNHLRSYRISMHIPCGDAQTSQGKTTLEQRARESLLRIVQCLKKFPGLENLRVSSFSAECGVRETQRILGEEIMRVGDYVAGKVYEDAICYCFYPVDRHESTGIHQIFLEKDVVPTIPYAALIPKGSQHLLAAGRCVSSDRDTNSAVRVEAPCMAMGQAAGTAAALSAQQGLSVAKISYSELCLALQKIPAEIPCIVPQKSHNL